jgi:hypothetical protein
MGLLCHAGLLILVNDCAMNLPKAGRGVGGVGGGGGQPEVVHSPNRLNLNRLDLHGDMACKF